MLQPIYVTFLAVADTGSFSKAARKCFMSPVAVMNQMNRLEKELGVKLFVRTNRGVSLTCSGKILRTKIIDLQRQADRTLAEVRAAAMQDKIPIRVGSSMMRPATFLTKVWQDSKILQQKYTLQIFPFHDDQFHEKWLSSVLGKEFDCITSPYDVKSWYKNFRVLRLGEEKFKLAVPFSHPLSKLSGIKLSDLFGCTLLTPPRLSPAVDKLCRALEKKYPQIQVMPLPAFYTASTFSEHQEDILLTRDTFQTISSAFRTIEVDWDFSSPTGIIFPLHPEPKIAEFISLLEQESKNLSF